MENTDPATDMSVPEIIRELTPYTGRFPEKAVRAAIAKRGEVAPHLVQALEDVVKDPARYAGDQDLMLHVFAVFLLGQFRDKRAYRPLIEMVSVPGDMAFDLLGDTITENLKNLLGSVYDGDPAPLQQLIENSEAEEFVRNAAVRTFPVLVHTGQMSRKEAADYYRSLFRGRLERNPNHTWNGLACSVADLPAPELLQELRQAYDDELVEPGFAGFDELERAARQSPEQFTARVAGRFDLVDDAVTEMKSWAAFQPDGWTPPRAQPQSHSSRPHLPADYQTGALVRPKPDVGRNDPCPCGSGRKYKKCCLGKS